MDEQEIQRRAATIGRPFVNLNELSLIADVSRQVIWALPENEKPAFFRMAGTSMIGTDDAVIWATKYWAKKNSQK